MKELTDFLDKHGVEYTIDGEHVLVPGGQRRVQMSDDAATAISFLMGLAALFLWGWAR